MQLSELGEFGLIKRLRSLCKERFKEIIVGIGDDAAAIKTSSKTTLITSDMLLEGVHFNLAFTTFYQLGYKALAVNISDIFAMGGKPRFFLMDIGSPAKFDFRDIKEIYRGTIKLAKKFGVAVIGGDTSASKHGLVLSGTLLGEADRVIKRSGAKVGDGIFVTDTLGDSAMGLMLLKKMRRHIKMQNEKFKIGNSQFTLHDVLPLLKRHLMPTPLPLEKTSGVTSMIDISDGLLIDLSHICDESRVGAVIYRDKIPLSKELINVAGGLGKDPLFYAFKGGEDYALLFTSTSNVKKNAVRIGEIIKKGRYIVDSEGKKTAFKAEGYEHFK